MGSVPRLPRGTMALAAALAAVAALAVSPAHAALRLVPQDHPTIQAAIDAAANGDSIGVATGTYVESLVLAGKNVTLYGSGSPPPVVTTNHTARVLEVGAGVTSATRIVGLEIARGEANQGGGMRCAAGASPRIQRCVFTSNRAYLSGGDGLGGALHLGGGSDVVVEDCTFLSNSARVFPDGGFASGGAIHCAGGATLTVRRTRFDGNVSQGLEGGPGGAISATLAVVTVDDCTFEGNGGGDGVAIHAQGALTVEDSEFRSNHAGYGAAAIHWSTSGSTALQMDRNLFHDNTTVFGGIVYAQGLGTIERCTIAFNQHPSTDAALRLDGGFLLTHSIVSHNSGYGVDGEAGTSTVFCSDVWGNDGGDYGPTFGDPTGVAGNISADPLYCDPAGRNFTLQEASPCAPGDFCGLRGARGVLCTVSVPELPGSAARAFLAPVAPNPARNRIDLRLELPRATHARLVIVDAAGRRRATVADGPFSAGSHALSWRATSPLEPGVYWAVLDAERRHARRFVILP